MSNKRRINKGDGESAVESAVLLFNCITRSTTFEDAKRVEKEKRVGTASKKRGVKKTKDSGGQSAKRFQQFVTVLKEKNRMRGRESSAMADRVCGGAGKKGRKENNTKKKIWLGRGLMRKPSSAGWEAADEDCCRCRQPPP